jgi:hypothetical protein
MEKKTYDFSKVSVEVEFEKFTEVDLAKQAGNTIHQGTSDIGTDEKAREIYKKGRVEIPDKRMREVMAAIIMESNLIVPVKQALKKLLES